MQRAKSEVIEQLREKYKGLVSELDERCLRLWAATEARVLGRGGVSWVAEATGLTRPTIYRGVEELEERRCLPQARGAARIRRVGGGRKSRVEQYPRLSEALEKLVDPATCGDPGSPLRWTSKSTRKLAAQLRKQGYPVSPRTVARLLREMGYRLQANRRTNAGGSDPDRDAQFAHINQQAKRFARAGQPVISVDAKKKELVGHFKNSGREWRPKGHPELVQLHDFPDPELGKALPYGIYDIYRNEGWVNVGIDHNTAALAVESIRTWWQRMGAIAYPEAKELLITADSGGSNSARSRLWKVELQKLANDTGLRISVCHFPPGTSKWNKIEHRLFCHITENWRGRPLLTHQVAVNLIAHTTTQKGLTVRARLDTKHYPTGIRVSDEELDKVTLKKAKFHGEWNYTIVPQKV